MEQDLPRIKEQSVHHLLIVDDDVTICESLTDIFELRGYQVHSVQTGLRALEVAREFSIETALIDIRLPDMEGIDLLRDLKTINDEMTCVIITGQVTLHNAVTAIKEGADGYFTKPLLIDDVLHTIEGAQDKRNLLRQLRKSEAGYRRLVQTSNDAILSIDELGRITLWNQVATDIFGHERSEIPDQQITAIIPTWFEDERLQNLLKSVAESPSQHRGSVLEINGIHRDGRTIPLELSLSTVRSESGYIHTAIMRDISERKRAEERIRSAYEEQRIFNHILQTALANTTLDRQLESILQKIFELPWLNIQPRGAVFINDPRRRKLIMKAQQGLSENVKRTCQNVDYGFCLCGRAAESEEIIHTSCLIADHETGPENLNQHGHYIMPVRLSGQLLGVLTLYLEEDHQEKEEERNFLEGICSIIAIVIRQRQTGENLSEAHDKINLLLSSVGSIIIGVSINDQVSHWNSAAEKILGIRSEDVLGKRLIESGIEWDWIDVLDALIDCLEQAQPVLKPGIAFRSKTGQEGVLDLYINPVRSEERELFGYIIWGNEMTEKTLLDTQLAESRKMESIGRLAAGIAHEINTPLQYINDNLNFLEQAHAETRALMRRCEELVEKGEDSSGCNSDSAAKPLSPGDLEYYLEQIPRVIEQSLEGMKHISNIISAMNEFSHPGKSEKVAVDINRHIESTCIISRHQWKYTADLELDLDPGLPPVFCLPDEIGQVLLNLVMNAAYAVIEAARNQGSDKKGRIKISSRRAGDQVEVRVSDTGGGIPEELHSRIFDPLFATKEIGRGTGQGLAIAYSAVVDRHNGSLEFESKKGEGTTFIMRIPIDSAGV